MKKIKVEKTKKGHPALWECGGGYSNTGYATIIASSDGQAKKAVYIRRRGELANAHHALFILEVGDYIIEADHHREDFQIQIFKITGFENGEETYAIVKQVNSFNRGEWDMEPHSHLEDAIEVAMTKATCYHCRSPHYILE